MDTYITGANIDHYLSLLNSGDLLDPERRAAVMKLLVEEEDKLAHSLEQLQFAEDRAAKSRDQVSRLKKIRDGFGDGSTEQAKADKLLANFEATHQLMEQFCKQMRQRVNSRGL